MLDPYRFDKAWNNTLVDRVNRGHSGRQSDGDWVFDRLAKSLRLNPINIYYIWYGIIMAYSLHSISWIL